MEFIESNFINTTTMISVGSNTISAINLFNPDVRIQYTSDTFDNDLTTASITISFTETVTVSRLSLREMNLKGFTLFYNGATANAFAMSTTADTTTTNYSSNSATSRYFTVTPVACTSVTLDMKTTIVANSEKAVGLFVISDLVLDFDRIPSSQNYKPMIDRKETVHQMSDGGMRTHVLKDKYNTSIKFKYITESFRNSLRTVYDSNDPFIFVPFPTSTSAWDAIIHEVVWTGDFNFLEYSDDAGNAGFSGSIKLNETTA